METTEKDDATLALEVKVSVLTEQRNNLFNTIVTLQDQQVVLQSQLAVQAATIKKLKEEKTP